MRRWQSLVSPFTDLLLPPRCQATNGDATALGGLSEETRIRIAQLADQPYCLHCGLSVGPHEIHDARDPCGRCEERAVGVTRVARVGTFSDPLITLVHRLKFSRAWEIAPLLAPFVYRALLQVSERTNAPVDAIVPVPLHWRRRVQRGFNQAEELARAVGSLAGWPVVKALRRSRLTQAQTRLDGTTLRAENMRGAFSTGGRARRGALAGRHVWLLDDVTTTGATLHAAATALRTLPKGLRPASINAVVVCVTDHRLAGADVTISP